MAMARVDNQEILRDDTIASLYDAAIEPATRRRGLSMLAQTLDAAGAFYLVWDKENNAVADCVVAGTLGADFATLYRTRWGAVDPRRRFLEAAHAESFFVSHYDRTDAITRMAASSARSSPNRGSAIASARTSRGLAANTARYSSSAPPDARPSRRPR